MNQVNPDEVQCVLLKVRARLYESDTDLEQLCATLPKPTEDFDAQAELRGTLECVRTDLLADALSTLKAACRRTKEEWRQHFEERSRLLVSESEEMR